MIADDTPTPTTQPTINTQRINAVTAAASAVAARVRDIAAARQADADAVYWSRVRDCARPDSEPDPDAIAEWLLSNNLDAAPFQQDVELVATRFELAAKLAEVPALTQQRDRLQAEMDAATRAFDEAAVIFRAAADRLNLPIEKLGEQIAKAQAGVSKLIQSCPYRHLVERGDEIGREITDTQKRRDMLVREARGRELGNAAELDRKARNTQWRENAEYFAAEADKSRARAGEIAEDAQGLTRRMHALEQERDALNAQMMEP